MARARRACACGAFLRRHRASSCCRSSTVIVMVTVGRPVRMPKRLKICPEAQEYYVMYLSNRTLERLPKVISDTTERGASLRAEQCSALRKLLLANTITSEVRPSYHRASTASRFGRTRRG